MYSTNFSLLHYFDSCSRGNDINKKHADGDWQNVVPKKTPINVKWSQKQVLFSSVKEWRGTWGFIWSSFDLTSHSSEGCSSSVSSWAQRHSAELSSPDVSIPPPWPTDLLPHLRMQIKILKSAICQILKVTITTSLKWTLPERMCSHLLRCLRHFLAPLEGWADFSLCSKTRCLRVKASSARSSSWRHLKSFIHQADSGVTWQTEGLWLYLPFFFFFFRLLVNHWWRVGHTPAGKIFLWSVLFFAISGVCVCVSVWILHKTPPVAAVLHTWV